MNVLNCAFFEVLALYFPVFSEHMLQSMICCGHSLEIHSLSHFSWTVTIKHCIKVIRRDNIICRYCQPSLISSSLISTCMERQILWTRHPEPRPHGKEPLQSMELGLRYTQFWINAKSGWLQWYNRCVLKQWTQDKGSLIPLQLSLPCGSV